ncbi:CHY zinc finger protein [Fructobacillus durionis]|uniref:Uncharacterized protein, contains Zn-finger domain of CHY type n=1 Tax=Fructobacillus durionis TaxID=283737 RepID=A0A1I1H6V5_9LACO|nr:CHY zinc finger protein [Fructobacillus durionis]SFC17788.1 Uncharacterized protein, contains Zn-finger domain of CHY type [Fructobacillus durionis]
MTKIYGIDIGPRGTCQHYHSELDVVALECAQCQRYYACYECHNRLADHDFAPWPKGDGKPVLCGVCQKKLSFSEYQQGQCIYCQTPFNPGCAKHCHIYFN